jgi:hypothetical protein
LFTNIPEDFFSHVNSLLFVSNQYVGEGTWEDLEIGGKGIELEEASKAYVMKLMMLFYGGIIFACE